MRERKPGRLAFAGIAVALVGCLALAMPATGLAKKKKRLITATVSTGSIAMAIPDAAASPDDTSTPALARSALALRIPQRATITNVTASVRISHGFDADLELYLASPRGVILLSRDNGGVRDNYGSGAASCAGTPTTFDSRAATPITAGFAPFVGTFAPQESLGVLAGLKGAAARVPWTLEIADDSVQDAGTLHCWTLNVQYRPPKKKKRL